MTEVLKNCRICPRNCGVDRNEGNVGFCRTKGGILVSRASLHHWEEPCISGTKGSGTVFFSGCNLACVFCQNYKISRGNTGKEISPERLSEIFFELKEKGAHNINLVTPTHFLPFVIKAVKRAKDMNINIPFVYNCGGYEKVESIKSLEGLIDIYMPDFKYMSCELSKKYSNAPDYADIAKSALSEMVRQIPECEFDNEGIMKKGVIVRHMMLPGCISDSKKIIKYLTKTYKNQIFVSIMNQFTPTENLVNYPEINRKVTIREYEKLLDFALSQGLENAFIQEGETAKESFIPDFDMRGV